jgi:HSP20 family molecular chaperone IbpA
VELKDYDPYRAIGGLTPYAKFMIRQRGERDDAWHPVMEAFHTYDDMVLRYELAGVAPEDIDIRVDGRVLYVQGERRRGEAAPEELTMRDERRYGPFERHVALPEGTDPAGVRASYLHGLLEIRVAHVHRPEPTVVTPAVGEEGAVDVPVRPA